jgi:GNAT superfamily N-acetyltransferase
VTPIRRISAEEIIAIRWPVLRPGFPRESAIFPCDDDAATVHLGAFHGERLCGVASIYRAAFPEQPEAGQTWQLRGMATLPEVRGLGLGRALLDACEKAARDAGGTLIWCNARVSAASFYSRYGWQQIGPEFEIPTVGPHFRMYRSL